MTQVSTGLSETSGAVTLGRKVLATRNICGAPSAVPLIMPSTCKRYEDRPLATSRLNVGNHHPNKHEIPRLYSKPHIPTVDANHSIERSSTQLQRRSRYSILQTNVSTLGRCSIRLLPGPYTKTHGCYLGLGFGLQGVREGDSE